MVNTRLNNIECFFSFDWTWPWRLFRVERFEHEAALRVCTAIIMILLSMSP